METRQLGTSGLIVSALGLGCMASYGPRDDEATVRTVRRAPVQGVDGKVIEGGAQLAKGLGDQIAGRFEDGVTGHGGGYCTTGAQAERASQSCRVRLTWATCCPKCSMA